MKNALYFLLTLLLSLPSIANAERVKVGAESTEKYFPLLAGKRVAVMTNQSGIVGDKHLIDVLVENPSLIQRPILIKGEVAMLGRPIENVKFFIDN